MFWIRIIALCFDSKVDKQTRIWVGLSSAWTIGLAWWDYKMYGYEGASLPADRILWYISPWIAGLVIFGLHRLMFPELYRENH